MLNQPFNILISSENNLVINELLKLIIIQYIHIGLL